MINLFIIIVYRRVWFWKRKITFIFSIEVLIISHNVLTIQIYVPRAVIL